MGKTDYTRKYNGIVDDLLDNDVRGNAVYENHVSGYTVFQMQNALKGALNLEEYKSNIKKIKNNATENKKIDQLFDYWINFILD